MSNRVKVHDFEDMMRPLAKAALDQGWYLKWTANGHIKFVPPKGPPVIVSKTNSSYHPNLKLLREGGLVVPEDREKVQPVLIVEMDENKNVTDVKEANPPPGPTPKEKKRMLPRGSVQNAVMQFFQSHTAPGIIHNLDDVVMHVKSVLPEATREVISTTCSQNASSGKLIREGKGLYRYARQDRRAEDKNLSHEEQQMAEEDEKVLNNFMDALAALQEWAAKMRKRSIQLNRLKKMLGGIDIQ